MAYKFQRGAATLSGSVTIEETLSVTGVSTLSALLSSSAKISGSSFWGNGAGLTNISSDNVDVADSSANSEFRLVGVAASGDGVTLTCMDTVADRITMNALTGKLSIAGALDVDGAATLNGNVTLGDAVTDVSTVTGYLTASKGIRLSNVSWIAANTPFHFSGEGGSAKVKGDGSNNLSLMGATLVSNAASFAPESAGAITLGTTTAELGHVYLADDKKIQFGSDQDATIEYDADGTAELRFAGAAATFSQNVSFDADVVIGLNAGHLCTVSGHLTASKGGLFSQNVQIATGKELKFVGNAAIDMSSAATGQAYISMADNLGEAFFIAQGANTYLTCVTTNSSEAVVANKDLKVGDAVGEDVFLSLYGGVKYHGQELVTGNKTISDVSRSHYICSGSGIITLTLPAAATGYSTFVKRHPNMSNNVKIAANGSDTIDGVVTDLVLETAGAAVQVVSSGSAWYVY